MQSVYNRKIHRRQLNKEVIIIYCNNSLCMLRVFESRVLRRILGPKREGERGSGENYIMRSLMIYTPHLILFG